MSLDISPEVEAHVVAQARQAGLSVDEYVGALVSQSEWLSGMALRLEAASQPLSPEELRAKLDRGLEQLKRREYVDGEQFMEKLLAGLDDTERAGRGG